MAKFKQIPQSFLYRRLLKYFGNMVRNYDEACRDDDFFAVVRNCLDHDRGVELVEAAYPPAELDEMAKARSRACRLDLSEPLDDEALRVVSASPKWKPATIDGKKVRTKIVIPVEYHLKNR